MQEVSIEINEKGPGALYIMDGNEKLGEMTVTKNEKQLTINHTEVFATEGKGLGKLLLNEMVGYAREHHLKVVPLCTFVHEQFKRHPKLYTDVWQGDKA
ncbi:MAG: GNAT family N-acetyltransferase [Ferruginibacter sp.]